MRPALAQTFDGLSDERPWTTQDVGRAVLLTGAGLLAELACWVGTSGTGNASSQLVWVAAAIAAATVVLLAGVQFLLGSTRTVQSAQRAVAAAVRHECAGAAEAPAMQAAALAGVISARLPVLAGRRVATTVMTRHHTPDCLLVQGKSVEPLDDAGVAARAACGVCA